MTLPVVEGASVVVGGSGVGDSVVITVVDSPGVVVVSTRIIKVLSVEPNLES